MTPKTLHFIRHAESELNRDRTNIGGTSSWCELNDLGKQQAASLGRRFARESIQFDRLCVSTTVRTQQTARYALDAASWQKNKMTYFPQLVEISQGVWEGQPRASMMTPEVVAQMRNEGWDFSPPSGESPGDVADRVMRWLDTEILTRPEPNIAIFTHGFVIRCVLVSALSSNLDEYINAPIQNTSINTLLFDPSTGYTQGAFNDIEHLHFDGIDCLGGRLRREKTDHESQH